MSEEKNKTEVLPLYDIRESTDVATFTASLRDMILDGKIDAAKAGVIIKKMEKSAETLLKDTAVKAVINDATEKYLDGQRKGRVFGADVAYTAVHTFYDYKDCGHPVLDALYDIQKEVDARIKLLEAELKLLVDMKNSDITPNSGKLNFGIAPKAKTVVVEQIPTLTWVDSGEIASVKAPKKGQKMGIKYSNM